MKSPALGLAACLALLSACAGGHTPPAVHPPASSPAIAAVSGAEPANTPAPPVVQPWEGGAELTADCVRELDASAPLASQLSCVLWVERWPTLIAQSATLWQGQSLAQLSLLPAEKTAALHAAFEEHASPARLEAGFAKSMLELAPSLGLPTQLAWYRSALGQKYLAAVHQEPDEAAMNAWLRTNRPDAKRKRALAAYERATRTEQLMHALLLQPMTSMTRAALASGASDAQPAADDGEFASIADALAKKTHDSVAYLVRDLSTAELTELTVHVQKPEQQRAIDGTLRALQRTIDEAAAPLGQPFREAMEAFVAMLDVLGKDDSAAAHQGAPRTDASAN